MSETCDLARRNCEEEAAYEVRIIDEDDDGFGDLIRYSCSAHVGWYRREFGKRGYTVEVSEVTADD